MSVKHGTDGFIRYYCDYCGEGVKGDPLIHASEEFRKKMKKPVEIHRSVIGF